MLTREASTPAPGSWVWTLGGPVGPGPDPDADDDGIVDALQPPGTASGAFRDVGAGPSDTVGSIVSAPAGVDVAVTDAPDPAGVTITVTGSW